MSRIWSKCLQYLQSELPDQQYNTWIRPLHGVEESSGLCLLAPNRFVVDWVKKRYLKRIEEIIESEGFLQPVVIKIGSLVAKPIQDAAVVSRSNANIGMAKNIPIVDKRNGFRTDSDQPQGLIGVDLEIETAPSVKVNDRQNTNDRAINHAGTVDFDSPVARVGKSDFKSNLNESFTFDSFVEGKSNQLGRAAALQVAENPGGSYNPLFIYGGVGLGKTHLMHSVGNYLVKNGRNRVVYLHSERFVADMVKALQTNAISEFKRFYRSVDALLIDDIQFFSGKERSQEEFFHTFNALLEGRQQMILTSDRYPKEISGVEERLKSRFGWGLTVAVEPPELETRVAIIKNKAMQTQMNISDETAFFIAQKVCSNVRELEGALKRVIANAQFTGKEITLDFVKESLKDLLAIQDRQVSIDNIQKTVAEYYKIKVADLLSKRRNRSVARPRQVAMSLAKELTNHSLPEIGHSFGGRDHTTVLHGCRKVIELRASDQEVDQDFIYLTRLLTT